MIHVVLADDQALVRRGIRSLLDLTSDIRVVHEAVTGEEAVAKVVAHRPDVALFDVRMPGCDGVEAFRRCKAAGYAPPTILLTTFDDDEVLKAAVAVGIAGFMLKDVELEELVEAVRAVVTGRTLIGVTAQRARESVRQQGLTFDALDDASSALTPREIEILRLVAAGMSNREIGAALGVTEGTVKNHASNILSKLGVRDRTRAVLKALERGII